MKFVKRAGCGLLVLLAICVVIGVIVGDSPETDAVEPAVSNQQEATATNTPEPVATKPSAPSATQRPQPTATATTTSSEDEEAYIAKLRADFSLLAEGAERLGALMSEPRIRQDDWTIPVVVELVTWQMLYDEAVAMTPPARYTAQHEAYIAALELLTLAADDIMVGIDTLDSERLNDAWPRIRQSSELITTLSEEIANAAP